MLGNEQELDMKQKQKLTLARLENHTEAFWNEVDKVMSDYRERKEWLRTKGASMDV